MSKSIFKILSVTLVLAMLFSFAGCEKTNTNTDSGESTGSDVSEQTSSQSVTSVTKSEDGVYTVSNNDDVTTFAIFSDTHVGKGMRPCMVLEKLGKWTSAQSDIDYVLFLGDNINDGYVNSRALMIEQLELFNKYIVNLQKPYFMLRGNHDADVTDFDENFIIECGNTNVIGFFADYYQLSATDSLINSGKVSDSTLSWLESALEKSAGKRVILACHYPIADKDDVDFGSPILPETNGVNFGREKILELAEKYNVELYFSGHDHRDYCPSGEIGTLTNFSIGLLTDAFAIVRISENNAVIEIRSPDSPDDIVKKTEYTFKN